MVLDFPNNRHSVENRRFQDLEFFNRIGQEQKLGFSQSKGPSITDGPGLIFNQQIRFPLLQRYRVTRRDPNQNADVW